MYTHASKTMYHFGNILESFSDQFGLILGPHWGHFGIMLEQVFAKRSTIAFFIAEKLKKNYFRP